MTIQIRDDKGVLKHLLTLIDPSQRTALQHLLIDFWNKNKHLLNDDDKNKLAYLEIEQGALKVKIFSRLIYQGSNIRERIKDMIIKNVSSRNIVKYVHAEIERNKHNLLIKDELKEINDVNTIKNYDYLKDQCKAFRIKNHYNRTQLMSLDFNALLKGKFILNADSQESEFNKTKVKGVR